MVRSSSRAERAEHQPLVDAVPQLGRKRPPRLGERRRCAALVRRVRAEAHPGPRPSEGLGPEVGGEHHHRAREVDLAALAVGEAALLEQLEEQHQHVAVRLLHLVQQHHRARPSPDGLGELAAVLVPDVPRRCADEAGGGVRLGQLAHVEPDERVARPEEHVGQRASELGLADPGRSEEEEAPQRTAAGEAGVVAPEHPRHALHGPGVAHHPRPELFLEPEQPRGVAGEEPLHRQPGDARHHLGHVPDLDPLPSGAAHSASRRGRGARPPCPDCAGRSRTLRRATRPPPRLAGRSAPGGAPRSGRAAR